MRKRKDYHAHTTYCDGADTPEKMAEAAYRNQFACFGFSGHGFFDQPWKFGMDEKTYGCYRRELDRLKKQYEGKMEILAGVEQECLAGLEIYPGGNWKELEPGLKPDYIIGSCHCIEKNGVYVMVDESETMLEEWVNQLWNGDWYRMAADYYETEGTVYERTECQIIGHFDLITKFNQDGRHFREEDSRYLEPAMEAMKKLNRVGIPFEINTGAISRGYRKEPYPSPVLLKELKQMGGRIMINSDCHSKEAIGFLAGRAAALAWSCGFRTTCVWKHGKLEEENLQFWL